MKEEKRDEDRNEQEAGERDLRYGDAFGTGRDRSSEGEDAYLDPETGTDSGGTPSGDEPPEESVGSRDFRYGDAFGTQRDRSSSEEDGYLDPEFGSREFDRPGRSEPADSDEGDDP